MASQGIVRSWDIRQMQGVIDSEDTPGGSYTSFPAVALPGIPALAVGQHVRFEWSRKDPPVLGFQYETTRVWRVDDESNIEPDAHKPFRARLWKINPDGTADEIKIPRID
ncbi:hypothetical protein [Rhodococcus aetherivorans]|uniref:hypothetical protein n=1 Tax=Rhodococcus aetherivorans TaxID=191292 RepID=UPI0012DFD606|nr:hypothetical protein [Rhodococcus aetherivorans]